MASSGTLESTPGTKIADEATALTLEARAGQGPRGLTGYWQVSDGRTVLAEGSVTLSGDRAPAAPATDDWALYAALPAIVARGGRVRLQGAATRRGLSDAAEITRAWSSFSPDAAHRARLEADRIVEAPPLAQAGRAALALGASDDVAGVIPPAVTLAFVILDAPAGTAPPASAPSATVLALSADGPEGPAPSYFLTMARRAAGLHLASAEARYGLLRIDAAMTPHVGAPSTPAHAAAFLSGTAMEVIPLLDDGQAFRPRFTPAKPGLIQRRAPITLHFSQAQSAGTTRREMVLEGLADRPRGDRLTMWWEMPGETDMPTPPVLDQMVAASVIPALERGQDLVVKGPISRIAALNLPLLAATRAAWGAKAPRGPVTVTADSVLDLPARADPPRAVLTFSGGADSFYSLLNHTGPDASPAEPKLEGAVLTLGFDFPFSEREAFETHRARVAPVLERRGVALHIVHTNSRDLDIAWWDVCAMPMVSAALSQFAHRYTRGLLGGSLTYPVMAVPMIQPPLLDRTLTGGWFWLSTDGAGIGRTEKIALIAEHADAMAVLRVCYEQNSADFVNNCCTCLKCQRTMLNFLGAGVTNPPCFRCVPSPLELAETPLYKNTDPSFAAEVITYARAHGTAGEWTDRLAERIATWQPPPGLPPKSRSEWMREKIEIWSGRMAKDPVGTVALGWNKIASRIDRYRR